MQSGIALASARAGNVIGGGDWAVDRLVPDILRAFEKSLPVVIRYPYSVRPWQHVLEPLSGYLMLAERLCHDGQTVAEGWNFGPNDQDVCSVHWIVKYMAEAWGGSADWSLDRQSHPHEATYLKLDISKAKIKLGWHPRWDLGSALSNIVDWHHCWLSGSDVKAKCLQQISAYHDMPYALFRYDPEEEFELRREISLLETRLQQRSKRVIRISLAQCQMPKANLSVCLSVFGQVFTSGVHLWCSCRTQSVLVMIPPFAIIFLATGSLSRL
jgi:hypothetical protein